MLGYIRQLYGVETAGQEMKLNTEQYIKCDYLNNPGTVCKSHDISLFPEESRVWALDHLKLAQ